MPGRLRNFTKKLLLTTNIIVAILFLLGCYAASFNPATWWFLGLLTLAAFYLFIVLFLFFIFWLFAKRQFAWIFIVAIVIAWKPIRSIIPLRTSGGFTMQKQADALRVMDWNVAQFEIMEYRKNHPEKKQQMMELINEYQPDIACFQEMVCGDSSDPVVYHLNGFIDTLKFPYHFYAYNYKENFYPHTHFGIIIFSKYPIINQQKVSFHPHDYNSIFQYADIVKGADTIRIINLHMQSLRFSNANLNYIDNPTLSSEIDIVRSKNVLTKLKKGFLKRQVQADRIRAEIDKSPYPVIVCGDFNDVPNSYAYKTIGAGLQDAFVQKGYGLGRTFSGIAPTLRIDNIFTDERFTIQQFIRINKKLSDHFPVIADITANPK